jgi:hypothetical protein
MPKEPLGTRVTRIEEHMAKVAENMAELNAKMNILADVQIQIHKEMAERDRITDERIGKLVSAIGQLISRIPPEALR